MSSISVLIPVLSRPKRVSPLVENLKACSAMIECRPFFILSPGDDAERKAVEKSKAEYLVMDSGPNPGDYAAKINLGFQMTYDPFVFLAADDLYFHPGWAERAVAAWHETGACVIGTNDLGNQRVIDGRASTHTLIHRDYGECGTVDAEGILLHEGYWHNFCNTENAPIWMADLTFKDLGDIEVGDEVMGWQRNGENVGGLHPGQAPLKRLCSSIVLATARRRAPIVRVRFESGRMLDCTADHLWFNGVFHPSSQTSNEWVTPEVGRQLLHVASEPSRVHPELEHLAGWLAGIYDGEGSGVYVATQCSDKNPEVYAAIKVALERLRIPFSLPESGRSVGYFNLTGGRQGYLDFLLRVRPVKRDRLAAKIMGSARFGMKDRIVSVERAPNGEGWVRSMTTTTGNYVAWGYASKNCDTEFVDTAISRETFYAAADSVVEHLHPNWGKAPDDATYRRGMQNFSADRQLFNDRERLWK